MQSVATILRSFIQKLTLSTACSAVTQGFVDIFGGLLNYTSCDQVDEDSPKVHDAVCHLLKTAVTIAKTANLTFDGWSAALDASVLGVSWTFIDELCEIQAVSIAALDLSTSR